MSGRLIAVDLTPMVPGGENGGAKVLTLDLLRRLQRLAPQHRFLLLTSSRTHDEPALLDLPRMERVCVVTDGATRAALFSSLAVRLLAASDALARRAPGFLQGVIARMRPVLSRLGRVVEPGVRLRARGVELLFCPFTAPTYAEPGIPVVSIVYDLQHVVYPQFFTTREIAGRNMHLEWVRRLADRVVCISEYSRQSFLDHTGVAPDRVLAVPIAIHDRLRPLPTEAVGTALLRLGLTRPYILYPANDWPHKNHRLLMAAFGMLRARRRELDVDLVFTGSFERSGEALKAAATRMGLARRVHWLGYLEDADLAAVYQGCRMVVFPSLYEGFGIPVLEAMAFDRPVACSRATSLPEVAGDAVRYFDPRRPEDIAGAMQDVLGDSALSADLARRGRGRAGGFDGDAVVLRYLDVFEGLCSQPPALRDTVTGVFEDGWTAGALWLSHAVNASDRTAELDLELPEWAPLPQVRVETGSRWPGRGRSWVIPRGSRSRVRIRLPQHEGQLGIRIRPLFRPTDHGLGDDVRQLGCLCHEVRIVDASGSGPNLRSLDERAVP